MGVLSEFGVDEARLTEIMKFHNESFKWLHDNLSKIQDSHEGKFIAICKKKIVSDDKDKGKLYQKLKEKFTNAEIEEIFIDYINPKGYVLILCLNWD